MIHLAIDFHALTLTHETCSLQFYKWFTDLESAMKSEVCFCVFIFSNTWVDFLFTLLDVEIEI